MKTVTIITTSFLLTIFLHGIFRQEKEAVPENETVTICNQKEHSTKKRKSTDQIKCLHKIANKGESFDLSTRQAVTTAERKLFREIFRNGDYFNYGIVDEEDINLEEFKKKSACTKPSFSIVDLEKIKSYESLREYRNYEMKENEISHQLSLRLNIKNEPTILYFWPQLDKTPILNVYLNHCRQSVSTFKNNCTFDQRLDLEFIDIFLLKNQKKAIMNIYCKKSYENEWTLLSSKYLDQFQ